MLVTSVNLAHLIGFAEAGFRGVMPLGMNETHSFQVSGIYYNTCLIVGATLT